VCAPSPTTPFTYTSYAPHALACAPTYSYCTFFRVRTFTYYTFYHLLPSTHLPYYTFHLHFLCTTHLSVHAYIFLLYIFFVCAPLPTTPFTYTFYALHTLACSPTYPYCNFLRVHTFTYYTCHLQLLSTTHLSVRAYIFLLSFFSVCAPLPTTPFTYTFHTLHTGTLTTG